MRRIVDITEKLSLNESPAIVIKGHELVPNTDAGTALKLMGIIKDAGGRITPEDIMDIFDLIFPEDCKQAVSDLKLSFKDFNVVVDTAISLILDNDGDGEGEIRTRTTT